MKSCECCLKSISGWCRYRGVCDPAVAPVTSVIAAHLCAPVLSGDETAKAIISQAGLGQVELSVYRSRQWNRSFTCKKS